MCTSKHDNDLKYNSIKPTNANTTKIINQTFDDAKNKARKAIDETHKGLPRYIQTVTNNQEQTVNAARDIIDNYIESQRDITNSFQSAWTTSTPLFSEFSRYGQLLSMSKCLSQSIH
jgi:hypothetical protein